MIAGLFFILQSEGFSHKNFSAEGFIFIQPHRDGVHQSYFCSGHCHTYWEVKQTLEMLLVMRGKQSEIVCQIVQTSLKSDIWKFVGLVVLVFAIKK